MNSNVELEARYPEADFSVYFRHLDACRRTLRGRDTQEHHICPKKQFPEFADSPENLITLRVDDHAFAHRLLEAACGIKAPSAALLAMQRAGAEKGGYMTGSINGRRNKELSKGWFALGAAAKGGSITGRKHKENNTGIFVPEVRGVGGRKTKENKIGIFAPEMRGVGGRISGRTNCHFRWHVKRSIVNLACSLCAAESAL